MDSLNGIRVLNTRPHEQGQDLAHLINTAGGISVPCPLLAIQPTPLSWWNKITDWQTSDYILFTSANAVKYCAVAFLKYQATWPEKSNIIAIGSATRAALVANGLHVSAMPSIADSEHLLALAPLRQVKNKTIILIKGKGGREIIGQTLKKRQAHLITLDVYHRVLPSVDADYLLSLWQDKKVDIILFTSQEAMQNLFLLFTPQTHTWLRGLPCLVISQRLADAAASLGMHTILVSKPHKIIETLQQYKDRMIHG